MSATLLFDSRHLPRHASFGAALLDHTPATWGQPYRSDRDVATSPDQRSVDAPLDPDDDDGDDDGCPHGDPDCYAGNGDRHDECSTFAEREAEGAGDVPDLVAGEPVFGLMLTPARVAIGATIEQDGDDLALTQQFNAGFDEGAEGLPCKPDATWTDAGKAEFGRGHAKGAKFWTAPGVRKPVQHTAADEAYKSGLSIGLDHPDALPPACLSAVERVAFLEGLDAANRMLAARADDWADEIRSKGGALDAMARGR